MTDETAHQFPSYISPYAYQQREKLSPPKKQPSWISRVLLAIFSFISLFLALQTMLIVHGILYEVNMDPGSNTHTLITLCFVLFVLFVVLANVLYNRKR